MPQVAGFEMQDIPACPIPKVEAAKHMKHVAWLYCMVFEPPEKQCCCSPLRHVCCRQSL